MRRLDEVPPGGETSTIGLAMRLHIQEAERLGHNGIGCEHLLLGMLADEAGIAAQVLATHGVALEPVRRRVAEMTGDGWQDSRRWT